MAHLCAGRKHIAFSFGTVVCVPGAWVKNTPEMTEGCSTRFFEKSSCYNPFLYNKSGVLVSSTPCKNVLIKLHYKHTYTDNIFSLCGLLLHILLFIFFHYNIVYRYGYHREQHAHQHTYFHSQLFRHK